MKVLNQEIKENYAIYNGDCIEVIKGIPDKSIGFSIFSPPFADLYSYSASERDLGNSNYNEFFIQFQFLITELKRVIQDGRLVSVHCMNLPIAKERDGYIGIKDFRSDIIREFQKVGFIFHSEVVIWKDPLIAAVRTKALGLMHKQLQKDSAMSRQGIPDYVVTFRNTGENKNPITHKEGLTNYAGSNPPLNYVSDYFEDGTKKTLEDIQYERSMVGVKGSHLIWQKYASPVWMDIRQTYVLQKNNERNEKDEKHICPLQLDVIERCLELWSNETDIVLSPFAGIGSEGYKSLELNRKFIGIELKPEYYEQMTRNLEKVEKRVNNKSKSLFD